MSIREENNPDTQTQARSSHLSDKILLQYYGKHHLSLSPEGVLKCISVIACIISSMLFVWGGSCARAPRLVASAATTTLVAGVALLSAVRALHTSHSCLYLDIVVLSVAGVVVLMTGVLSMTTCDLNSPVDYLNGPLAIATAGVLVAGAAITYTSAMREGDSAATVEATASLPPPLEIEV